MSPDRRTWTLHLRPGVRLHDGREGTATDVAAAIDAARQSDDADPGLWDVCAVTVTAEHAVRVDLRQPTSLLLDALAVVDPLPTGPYREHEQPDALPELHATLAAGTPAARIATVRLRRYDTPRAAVAALLRQEVDVLSEVPSEARDLLSQGEGVRRYPYVKPYVVTFGLNHRHRALSKPAVRVALNVAVDRQALIAEELRGFGTPAADIIWREHWAAPHAGDAEAIRVDRARAERLLDGAGLTRVTRADGTQRPRLRLRVLVLDEPTMLRVAARLKRMYAPLGLELELESLPVPRLLARLGAGEYETYLSPIVSGYGLSLPYRYFADHRRSRLADHGYTAARAAAERVRAAPDTEAFASAVMALHRVLLDDPPDVYLFWQQAERALGPRITVPADAEGDVLSSLSRWAAPAGGS